MLSGVLYVSFEYKTASHLCACGCGNVVVTPFDRGDNSWRLNVEQGKVHESGSILDLITLHPSIGNQKICGAHYWIRKNKIIWC